MKIDDQFNPNLAFLAKPSGKNAFNIVGDGISDFIKQRDNAEIKAINEDAIREKIAASQASSKRDNKTVDENILASQASTARGEKQVDLNAQQTKSNIKIADANIDFKTLGQTFNQEMDTKTFNLNKKTAKQKKTIPKAKGTVDLSEINKTISKRNAPKVERTITRTGMQNGRKVVEYSDGSIEYGS